MSSIDWISAPFIGADLEATIVDRISNHEYRTQSLPKFPSSWEGRLRLKDPVEYEIGDTVEAWIFEIEEDQQRVLLSTDEFGRHSVSDSMRPRYVNAAQHIRWLYDQVTFPQLADIDSAAVSDFKGVINRCYRRDRPDWCTLYDALGRPPQQDLQKASTSFGPFSSALRDQDRKQAKNQFQAFERTSIPDRLPFLIASLRTGDESFEKVSSKKLRSALQHMDGIPFEDFVADCWQQMGWTIERTPTSHDDGIDVIATRESSHPKKVVIQAKCYIDRNTVGAGPVKKLAKDRTNEPNVDEAYLVTSGTFTGPAHTHAADYGITLIDVDDLLSLIDQERLYPVVDAHLTDAW